jgi:hypothetical protein
MNPLLSLALLGNLVQAQGPSALERVDGASFKSLLQEARAAAEGPEGFSKPSKKAMASVFEQLVEARGPNRKLRRRLLKAHRQRMGKQPSARGAANQHPVGQSAHFSNKVHVTAEAGTARGADPLSLARQDGAPAAEWGTLPALEGVASAAQPTSDIAPGSSPIGRAYQSAPGASVQKYAAAAEPKGSSPVFVSQSRTGAPSEMPVPAEGVPMSADKAFSNGENLLAMTTNASPSYSALGIAPKHSGVAQATQAEQALPEQTSIRQPLASTEELSALSPEARRAHFQARGAQLRMEDSVADTARWRQSTPTNSVKHSVSVPQSGEVGNTPATPHTQEPAEGLLAGAYTQDQQGAQNRDALGGTASSDLTNYRRDVQARWETPLSPQALATTGKGSVAERVEGPTVVHSQHPREPQGSQAVKLASWEEVTTPRPQPRSAPLPPPSNNLSREFSVSESGKEAVSSLLSEGDSADEMTSPQSPIPQPLSDVSVTSEAAAVGLPSLKSADDTLVSVALPEDVLGSDGLADSVSAASGSSGERLLSEPMTASATEAAKGEAPPLIFHASEGSSSSPAVTDAVERINPFSAPDHIVKIQDLPDEDRGHRRVIRFDEPSVSRDQGPRVIRLDELTDEAPSKILRIDEEGLLQRGDKSSSPASEAAKSQTPEVSSEEASSGEEVVQKTQHFDATRGAWSVDPGQSAAEAASPAEPSHSVRPVDGGDAAGAVPTTEQGAGAPEQGEVAPDLELDTPPTPEAEGQGESELVPELEDEALEMGPARQDVGESIQKEERIQADDAVDTDPSDGQSAAEDAPPQEQFTGESELADNLQGEGFDLAGGEANLDEVKETKVSSRPGKVDVSTPEPSLEERVAVGEAELSALGEQTVRVEVDDGLSVEVTVGEEGIDVLVDGDRSSLDDLDDVEAELKRSLEEDGHHMASFTERDRDTGEQRRHENKRQNRFSKQADPTTLLRVRRGTYVNTVA